MSWEDFVKSPDMAGTVGAILGWLSAPGGTVRMQAVNLVAGLGCAVYVAPFVSERAGMGSHAAQMAFSFVVGLIGLNIIPKLTAAAKKMDWLARFLPTKGGGS